ncbi:MAG: LTA synthase family protein [Alphaproteobacteria bacterium]|nr:LTA synthase family protein [Alphaproteobacteria bacterium]
MRSGVLAKLLLATGMMHGLMALPAQLADLNPAAWGRVPPELAVLILALLALGPSVAGQALRLVATLAIALVTVLKLADLAMLESLGRRFNPVADLPLVDASVRLLAGSLGPPAAAGAVVLAVLLLLAILWGLWWACGIWMRQAPGPAGRLAALGAGAGLVTLLALAPQRVPAPQEAVYARDRLHLSDRSLAELQRFRIEARTDSLDRMADPLALIDRDVLIIFLESYGRTSFDTPFYASRHLTTLAQAQERLQQAGLALRSGFVTSPTHGGQSWLAHGTLANGLWIDSQIRYQAAIASGRRTLFHIAAEAGFHTAAVMPAIVRPWPEASTMGFQTILAAPDLGYRGQPFNWVTMPDQFTLAAADRLLRQKPDARNLFAQIALISSHAPWVPVPRMVAWEDLGDGTIFDDMARAGDPPEVVWRDRDRVRRQYRDAIGYTLQAVLDYAARQADDPPLMLLIGDHQAASTIGLDERREVPLHVIGPPSLVERTAEWGLTPGLVPPRDKMPLPMDSLRERILRSFSPQTGVPPA